MSDVVGTPMAHEDEGAAAAVPDTEAVRQRPRKSPKKTGSATDVGIVPDSSAPCAAGEAPKQSKGGVARKKKALTEVDKKSKRREQNRRNAAKCRQRKIDKVNALTEQLARLRDENEELKRAYHDLERKLRASK